MFCSETPIFPLSVVFSVITALNANLTLLLPGIYM